MNNSKPISPAIAGAILAVVLLLIVIAGYQYLNRPPSDPIAEAVAKQRANSGTPAHTNGPMIGAPPKAGGADYAPPPGSPLGKR